MGYQKHHGTEGNSLKSGFGFFIKVNTKQKPKGNLNNEFQSCWIENLLDNNQIH